MGLDSVISESFKESEDHGVQTLLENSAQIFGRSGLPVSAESEQLNQDKRRKVDEYVIGRRLSPPNNAEDVPERTGSGGLKRKKRVAVDLSQGCRAYYDLFFECSHCGSLECDFLSGEIVCVRCATCHPSFGWEDAGPGNMPFDDFTAACQCSGVDKKRCVYKRSAYLDDLLDQFLGTGRSNCPDWVFRQVAAQLNSGCSIEQVRRCLRSRNLQAYYKFAGEISRRMRTGGSSVNSDPKLNQQELMNFKALAHEAEKAFEAIRGDRKNFFNFRYLALQILSMLGRKDLVAELPPLKNKYRVKHHDELWEKVCRFCNWRFTPVLK